MHVDELYDDSEPEDPSWASPYVDGAWGRTANPNTADGELQNLAAFGTGLTKLTGPRRTAARVVVWLILIGTAIAIIEGVVGIISTW
ncbi:MAG TPA: hypothetical protein VFE40_11380 [Jatrophihabitantaceae bacterium]|nr:hypothetical protein [Jatrophihabitantaceae bacterium]